MSEKNNKSLDRKQENGENFFSELYNKLRLIVRLLKDERVNFLLKLIPIGSLVYLVVPLDFFPINPLDDGMMILLGFTLFIELCPQDIVQEHLQDLRKSAAGDDLTPRAEEAVVDGEYRDVPPGDE